MDEPLCAHCKTPLEGLNASAYYCSSAHRLRAFRRRRAGLGEDAYSGAAGARRGPLPLGTLSRQERFQHELRRLRLLQRPFGGPSS